MGETYCCRSSISFPALIFADAEIKLLSAEYRNLSKVTLTGQKLAFPALSTARLFAVLIAAFPVYSTLFSPESPLQLGAADAEIKVPSVENTELKGSPFEAWSRSAYSHTCYAYCQEFLPR